MTIAQSEFEERAPTVGAAPHRRDEGRPSEGARVRLVLAVAGLAALVAWGALSHVGIETAADSRSVTAAPEAPRYNGRGKWTGYTSERRSRPQILRDAGVSPAG